MLSKELKKIKNNKGLKIHSVYQKKLLLKTYNSRTKKLKRLFLLNSKKHLL
ncbi:hypothetical protein AAK27_759 [Mycoplasma capricolum subsp. capricolum]|nr:hypothetical protein AAK27_759 [Mycoplasma capricolum subsp. capricolum]